MDNGKELRIQNRSGIRYMYLAVCLPLKQEKGDLFNRAKSGQV
jgi:hypothetical protein